ncbi:MAG: acyl-protein synthetase [Elusimicrobia bacterium]|nr:acyl-protein synthetase [Elusimicrobiota bacterium]
MRFPNCEAVCRAPDPHVWTPAKSRRMVAACRELAAFHARNSRELAALYRRRGFRPGSIRTEADLKRIPMLGVTAMKHFLLTSLPHERCVLKGTSSGTRGQKTQMWFDADSLDRCQAQLTGLWEEEGLRSSEPTNYLMFVYDPKEAKDLGIAFSDTNQQRFAPAAGVFYAVRKSRAGAWEFQKAETARTLREYAGAGLPVRIFGIPSFMYEFLSEMKEPVRLPPRSWMVTGGGWKAAEDKQVSREFFRELASKMLGLDPDNIRDGYGMAEHAAPYLECRKHRFHVPVYNRVYARDPVTLEVLPPGRPGLLELITPFNAMMPNLAILTTDLGSLDPGRCPCGYNSPTFTLLGRGGLVKHKGCAIHAGEIVRRSS